MAIEYRPIAGYEDLYQISEYGDVYSGYRNKNMISTLRNNYLAVGIRKDTVRSYFSIHRLVATAFVPNPENKPFVNHIDGNKLNNYYKNLEWCTAKENSVHAMSLGLLKSPKGEAQWLSKLKEADVIAIRLSSQSTKELSAKYGIGKGTVQQVRSGSHWKHLPFGTGLKFRPQITDAIKSEIFRLHESGYSRAEIARKLNIHDDTVGRNVIRVYGLKNRPAMTSEQKQEVIRLTAAGEKPKSIAASLNLGHDSIRDFLSGRKRHKKPSHVSIENHV